MGGKSTAQLLRFPLPVSLSLWRYCQQCLLMLTALSANGCVGRTVAKSDIHRLLPPMQDMELQTFNNCEHKDPQGRNRAGESQCEPLKGQQDLLIDCWIMEWLQFYFHQTPKVRPHQNLSALLISQTKTSHSPRRPRLIWLSFFCLLTPCTSTHEHSCHI